MDSFLADHLVQYFKCFTCYSHLWFHLCQLSFWIKFNVSAVATGLYKASSDFSFGGWYFYLSKVRISYSSNILKTNGWSNQHILNLKVDVVVLTVSSKRLFLSAKMYINYPVILVLAIGISGFPSVISKLRVIFWSMFSIGFLFDRLFLAKTNKVYT